MQALEQAARSQDDAPRPRVGVWFVGARGSLATTAMVGASALRQRLTDPVGCVVDSVALAPAGAPPVDALVFGGHDVADVPLVKRAEQLADAGVVPHHLLALVNDDLLAADAEVRHGTAASTGQRGAVAEVISDLDGFRHRHRLDRVVVVDVSSTEPRPAPRAAHASLDALERALDEDTAGLPPSSVYAYAALSAGCPVVQFTPSLGLRMPALDDLAHRQGLPYAGCDGKTGETLVKSVLAPMFSARALRVRSWAGTNLLGGGDGATLTDAGAAASKETSKRRGLEQTLGYPVDGPLHIDYVADLGEWKTAWDHVSFEGFLGVRMTLQFTWQGCDSALAAPLVLDLARLTARAHEAGEVGALVPLAFFFKDPVGTDQLRLSAQYDALLAWADSLGDVR